MWKKVICKFATKYTIQPAGNSNNVSIVSCCSDVVQEMKHVVHLFFSPFLPNQIVPNLSTRVRPYCHCSRRMPRMPFLGKRTIFHCGCDWWFNICHCRVNLFEIEKCDEKYTGENQSNPFHFETYLVDTHAGCGHGCNLECAMAP